MYIYKESEQVNITLALTANGNGALWLFEHLKLKQTPDPVDPPVLIHPLQASPFPFWRTWNSALTVAEITKVWSGSVTTSIILSSNACWKLRNQKSPAFLPKGSTNISLLRSSDSHSSQPGWSPRHSKTIAILPTHRSRTVNDSAYPKHLTQSQSTGQQYA